MQRSGVNQVEVDEAQQDFTREIAAYERHRETLERDHKGKVALVHGNELVGVYDTLVAACEEAHNRFDLDPFMIKEISDPVHCIPMRVLPATTCDD
jgi:hypothetical protein